MATTQLYPATGLEIGFLGLPMVFNDGQAENTLRIALTNNNFFGSLQPEQDSDIVFSQDTPISIWFVVDVAQASEDAQRTWALTSYDALHDARVALTASPGDWEVRRSDALSGSPLNDSLNGWQLIARQDVTLMPGQSLVLTLSGLTSGLPDGPAFAYCEVVMPHLDANHNEVRSLTKTIGPITKSKVMITGERMGIGTGTPNSTLEVNGAVWARGGEPGEGDINNNGFFFDGQGDDDSGMTSLDNGNLVFYANSRRALTIQHHTPPEGPQVNAYLDGNLTISQVDEQPDSGHLAVDGDAHIGGNVTSQGRIQDQAGVLMPVGAIVAFGGSQPPAGWLLCNGDPVPDGTPYDELRDVLGDGTPLPDLRSRFVVGAFVHGAGGGQLKDDEGNELTAHRLHGQGGAEFVTLALSEMPTHAHGYLAAFSREDNEGWIGNPADKKQWFLKVTDRGGTSVDRDSSSAPEVDAWAKPIQTAGQGYAHENRPPYYALTYIIKY